METVTTQIRKEHLYAYRKIICKDREVTVRLSADEIVKLCNSLHYAPEKQQNDIYHKLYSDLLLVRDICQYGRIDNWGLAKVVEQRGLGNINKHIRGPKIKALKSKETVIMANLTHLFKIGE